MTEKRRKKLREFVPNLKYFGINKDFEWNKDLIDKDHIESEWDNIQEEEGTYLLTITNWLATLASWYGLKSIIIQGKLLVIPVTDEFDYFEPKYYAFDHILTQGEVFDLFHEVMIDYGRPLTGTPIFDRLKTQEINSDCYPGLDELFKDYFVNYPFDPNL